MYKIADEYGTTFPWSTPSYKMACAVAHFVRERGYSCGVVHPDTKRFTSEVSYENYEIDSAAKLIVDNVLLYGDFESRLESR